MMLDFALKDFIRKRNQTFPYVLIISMVIALVEFMIYFNSSLGFNLIDQNYNDYFFSGSINLVYSKFNSIIIVLMICLAFVIVIVITTTLAISRKRDIAIMKALGTLPRKLYGFYLIEAYVIFIIGFVVGLIFGLISYGIFAFIASFLGFILIFQIDFIFTPILFFSCFIGIFLISGFFIRKIGSQNIIKTFSRDIPCDYDASKRLTLILRVISGLGLNFKISIINTMRRKGEFKRYMIVFSFIFLVIFTLGLGTVVLNTSSHEWIRKSQGENLIVIGHSDVIYNYSLMYKMFSDPKISVNKEDIEFTDSKYLFSYNDIKKLESMNEIEEIDKRLIKFCDVKEKDGILYNGMYKIIGQQRTGNFPIIGINPDNIIQDFEIEGGLYTKKSYYDYITIGDGLAYNFFDYPFNQSLEILSLNKRFKISGVVIDSFFSGYAGYVGLDMLQDELNLGNQVINLVLIKLKNNTYNNIKEELQFMIKKNLGDDFTHLNLNPIFNLNLQYLSNLTLYPFFLIVTMTLIAILSIYNYQKAGLIEKARDFLIMRAIGSKSKSLKKILFLESFFVMVPSLILSLGIGMILNSTILFERFYLPPLQIPLIVFTILFITLMVLNFLSIIPLMKKIKRLTIRNFEIY